MRHRNLFGARHQRTAAHLADCSDCAADQRRERQYLERLRDASIPPASRDLTSRLLACSAERPADTSLNFRIGMSPRLARAEESSAGIFTRAAVMTAGGTVVAAGVLAVSAFAVAGPAAATPLNHVADASNQMPAHGRVLTSQQLSALRADGWACPELTSLGFQLESATAVTINGQPAVELRLTDGVHYALVTEEHPAGLLGTARAGAGDGAGSRVQATSPWTATYWSEGRTFTYESNLPADQADDAGPILSTIDDGPVVGVSAAAPASGTVAEESLANRLHRGLSRIVTLLTQ